MAISTAVHFFAIKIHAPVCAAPSALQDIKAGEMGIIHPLLLFPLAIIYFNIWNVNRFLQNTSFF
jgi:hypothetical protein